MNQLKIIAMVFMLIDHFAYVMIERGVGLAGDWYLIDRVMRGMGRIAFPIFCFLLVEGFIYTRNITKYMFRLGIFALISEIPYDLTFFGQIPYWEKQNVFFTLCLGVAVLYVIKYTNRNWEKAIYIVFGFLFAEMLKCDYGAFGVALIIWFYMLYDDKVWKLLGGAFWNLYSGLGIQSYGVFAMIPIGFYNGKRGKQMKYIFYFFYPVHLLLLYLYKKYVL